MSDHCLVTCESTAAIVLHAREVTDLKPVKLSGHVSPRPLTLCGTEAAWDTQRPIEAVHCRTCIAELAKRSIVVAHKVRR